MMREDIELGRNSNGSIRAYHVGNKVLSHVTHNKMMAPTSEENLQNPTPTEIETSRAVLKVLDSKGRAGDITDKTNLSTSDIVPKGDGSAEIYPDNGNAPYTISAATLDRALESEIITSVYSKFNESRQSVILARKIAAEIDTMDNEFYRCKNYNISVVKGVATIFYSAEEAYGQEVVSAFKKAIKELGYKECDSREKIAILACIRDISHCPEISDKGKKGFSYYETCIC